MYSAMMTVVDSHFHQNIINRYRKGKINIFRSPLLIFLKNKRRISSLKINVNALVNIFNKISKIFAENTKNAHGKNSLLSLIRIKHLIQQSIFRWYPLEGDHTDRIFLFQYHEKERMQDRGHIWPAGMQNVHLVLNNRTQSTSSFYPEAVYKVLLQGADQPISQYLKSQHGLQNIQRFSYNTGQHFTKTITIPDKTDVPSSIIRNIYQMVNNRTQFASLLYPEAVYKVILQGAEQTFEKHQYSEPAGISLFPDRPSISTAGEFLYFNDQRNIEQEIEEVKKITIDTREELRERSTSFHPLGDIDLKKHLDVHWLSDKVYQNIEQRIRIEKERRGL